MNASMSRGPPRRIRQDPEYTALAAPRRNNTLFHRGASPSEHVVTLSMFPFLIVLVTIQFVMAATAMGEPSTLTGETLRRAVSGKTVQIETPIGLFPIRYRSNGTMTGQAPGLVPSLGTEKDRGQWWIADDRLCQRWDQWLDKKQYCFKLQRVGPTVYWRRDDGLSGTAMIRDPARTVRPMSPRPKTPLPASLGP
jgi:hypothetical protein